ncbi:hypothetical protein HKX48_000324 [Thoreauomyces humboldtii]|nr:hypothetical protein HKX48_000324 [Thoreauomyces humboldtii]
MPNRDFYGVLEVDRNADAEAIRKAYRRKALRCHPDKAGQDPATIELFQLVQKSYDILSDPKKRQVYDKYGERGVAMMDSLGGMLPFIDPDFLLALNTFFIVGSLIAALLIIFPAFVAVRADGKVSWSWGVVAIPLFIFDICLLAGLSFIRGQAKAADEADEERHYENEGETPEQRKRREARARSKMTADALARWILFLVFQVFVVLRLDDTVTWSWALVFIPWFILELVSFVSKCGSVRKNFRLGTPSFAQPLDPENQEAPMRPFNRAEKLVFIYGAYKTTVLRLVQMGLLIAKFNGSIDASWPVVFLPTWLWSFFEIVGILLDRQMLLRAARHANPGVQVDIGPLVILRMVGMALVALFLYLGVGLLVRRLQSAAQDHPSAAVILIPVFIVSSLLFCCMCCCLPCILCCAQAGLEAELKGAGQEDANGQHGEGINLAEKRITYEAVNAPTTASSSRR